MIIDNVIPKKTQQHFLNEVTHNIQWDVLSKDETSTDEYQGNTYKCENLVISKSSGLCHVVFYKRPRPGQTIMKEYMQYSIASFENVFNHKESLYHLSKYVLDSYCEKANIDYNEIIRIKINNTIEQREDTNVVNSPHVDWDFPHKTLVYYINDCDGDTILFNEDYVQQENGVIELSLNSRIQPKMGRAICFDGLTYHATSNPINSPQRLVLNINFI